MPFSKVGIDKAIKGIRRRATGFVLLAILFLVVGFAQHAFVSHQIRKTTTAELNESADEIANVVYNSNQWDLVSYRQAFYTTSTWYVFAANGLLIDNEEPAPELLSLFRAVQLPANVTFDKPQTVVSEVGGQYRVLARKVQGGAVIACFDTESPTNSACGECIDQKLVENAEVFGTTWQEATNVSARAVDELLSFAVISDSGELKSGLGEIPLRLDPSSMLAAAQAGRPLHLGDKIYILVSKPIRDSKNDVVGTIVVPANITLQEQAIASQLKFNLLLAVVAFGVAVLISLYLIARELVKSPHFETLPEALRSDEGPRKEFKRAFQWDFGRNCQNPEVRIKALKTITAFLNSEGGVLFIGVDDDKTVRGIEEDLGLFNGSADKFLLTMRDLIASKIGAEFAPLVKTRCDTIDNKMVCVVEVENATEPAFLKEDGQSYFFVREGNRTNPLDPREAHAFIKSKRWDR
ncbi:MAG TPA: ATP-binding protein [Verrucomicrobiae bacterium]|jgi:hypothetical protein|nr:ATP-binding protein [Verrucomicrobiae bacterium]